VTAKATVLQPATALPPEIAKNVTLDTIAYPSSTEVQFGGRGKPGAFVRIYLDNAPFGQAIAVGPDGAWNVTDSGIAPKIYTLRVDEVNAAGKVISRYETPFKRETPAALAAAMGTTSGNAAAGTAGVGTAAVGATVGTATGAPATPGTSATTAPPAVQPAAVNVTVQPGYTLWGIARHQMGHGILYVQVWNANKDKIRNPNMIYPGQVFTLPQN
jgi:nucleoid-associated protein YgaU